MTGSQPPARRYTEKEVRAILQRAVEMQTRRASADPGPGTAGTTLQQLQQAAAELGLDPSLLAEAAAEVVEDRRSDIASRLLGGPWAVDSDHIVEGVVSEDDWPALLEEMRTATGRVGHPKTVGKAFEWLSLQPDGLHVSISPHGPNTRVRVTARFGQWGGLLYAMSPVPFALALAFLLVSAAGSTPPLDAPAAASLLTGLLLASLAGARVTFARLCARKRRQTRDLIATLERWIARPHQIAAETAPVQAIPPTTTVDSPLTIEQVNRLT